MFENQNLFIKLIICIIFVILIQICVFFLFGNKETSDLIVCNVNSLHDEKINHQGIFIAILYCVFGIIFPNNYLGIIIVSVIFEFVQPYLGNKPNYILGPMLNLSSYTIGSILGSQRIAPPNCTELK